MIAPEKQDALLKCAQPECGEEFSLPMSMSFDKFPVKCPKCGKQSGHPMLSCPNCLTHYAFTPKHPLEKCPKCGEGLPSGAVTR